MNIDPGPMAWPMITFLAGLVLGWVFCASQLHASPSWTCQVMTTTGPIPCQP